jgi:protein tyrosine phosphatase (PTP) superfamily phosphohydrolase (DUF442 family)
LVDNTADENCKTPQEIHLITKPTPKTHALLALVFCWLVCGLEISAGDLKEISNFRQYSETFASSGQPSVEDLQTVEDAGFERVIYLAFSDDGTAIEAEDRLVKEHGMRYVHIPVDFNKPEIAEFQTFLHLMQAEPKTKTLLHCQINLRASTFSMLYRVIALGVPLGEAKVAFDSVWQPNETWYRFIVSVLGQYNLSHECEQCDWGELSFTD